MKKVFINTPFSTSLPLSLTIMTLHYLKRFDDVPRSFLSVGAHHEKSGGGLVSLLFPVHGELEQTGATGRGGKEQSKGSGIWAALFAHAVASRGGAVVLTGHRISVRGDQQSGQSFKAPHSTAAQLVNVGAFYQHHAAFGASEIEACVWGARDRLQRELELQLPLLNDVGCPQALHDEA